MSTAGRFVRLKAECKETCFFIFSSGNSGREKRLKAPSSVLFAQFCVIQSVLQELLLTQFGSDLFKNPHLPPVEGIRVVFLHSVRSRLSLGE